MSKNPVHGQDNIFTQSQTNILLLAARNAPKKWWNVKGIGKIHQKKEGRSKEGREGGRKEGRGRMSNKRKSLKTK
jgi:hypothetical protein